MKIGKFIFGMRGHDIAESFRKMCETAHEQNILNLQFAPAKTINDVDFDKVGYDDELAANISDSLKKYGLKVSVLGCYIDPITDSTIDGQLNRFKNFIRYAEKLDAVVIGTETGQMSSLEETRSEKTFLKFVNNLEKLIPVAEKYNVQIGIEPVWLHTIYSTETAKRMLDYFNSDNLNIIFDPVNLLNEENYMNQRQIVENAVECFGDKIISLHLKDYIYKNGLKRVPVGTGDFDVSYCLQLIGSLRHIPDIMLDEMPLSDLPIVREKLQNIIL